MSVKIVHQKHVQYVLYIVNGCYSYHYINDDVQLHYNLQSFLWYTFLLILSVKNRKLRCFCNKHAMLLLIFLNTCFSLNPSLIIECAIIFVLCSHKWTWYYHPTWPVTNIDYLCVLFGLPTFNCACTQTYFPYFVSSRLNIRCIYCIVDIIIEYRNEIVLIVRPMVNTTLSSRIYVKI